MSQNCRTLKKMTLKDRVLYWPVFIFRALDAKVDGGVSFFLKHFGKSRFMLSMSKKARLYGLENLFNMGPKAFIYFFLFYLIRDVILYILIPIGVARWTD